MPEIDARFWRSKCVQLFDNSGFKGNWLQRWFGHVVAKVTGYVLPRPDDLNLLNSLRLSPCSSDDLCGGDELFQVSDQVESAIVCHLTARSLVRAPYDESVAVFETNVMGTVNVLDQVFCMSQIEVSASDSPYH